jgi:RHS repeat-associated protein
VTWTADSAGAVSATLRYDPWGTLTGSTGSSLPDFRFQGSWFDTTTSLAWVVSRWYAPSLGRFVSEDSLLGEAIDPPSRHLYAYAAGEPVGRWDPDGGFWYRVRYGDSVKRLATRYLGRASKMPRIIMANKYAIKMRGPLRVGRCIWIPNWGRNNGCSAGVRYFVPCPYPTPRPGFDPGDPTKTPVPWCPKIDEPIRPVPPEVHSVGVCQPWSGTLLIISGSGSLCAVTNENHERSLNFTLGAALGAGASLTGGVTYMISNGRNLHDQDGWFDVDAVSASLVFGGQYEIASSGGIKTANFGITGGVGVRATVGKSFTFVYADTRAIDMGRSMFPLNPWTITDGMLLIKDQFKAMLGGF